MATPSYERAGPQETTLYAVVRDNLATLYGAVDDGVMAIALPKFVRKELDGYLECGILCRGFARLRCGECEETRLVAFRCKGRGFCPSCMGRRMSATAAHLIEDVIPYVNVRQWVLTFPFAWRKWLGNDGALLSALTSLFVKTVLAFYTRSRSHDAGEPPRRGGAVVAVQRTSSDLKLNPHIHAVFLDGAYDLEAREEGAPKFEPRGHFSTREVGEVLTQAAQRMGKYLRRRGLVDRDNDREPDGEENNGALQGLGELAASAVSGRTPPAGPEFRKGPQLPTQPRAAMAYERPLCAALDGFTLHAATHAGGHDARGREALLKYILRPAIAQERIQRGTQGLVRIALKRAFSDGTTAIELDPLSLLARLAASVPAPRFHTVRYAGVLASASKLRSRIAPPQATTEELRVTRMDIHRTSHVVTGKSGPHDEGPTLRKAYRPWAELLKRSFGYDVLACHNCGGRMKLLAMVTDAESITRYLRSLGEPTELPHAAPARGPPYWQSRVLRRSAGSHVAAE